MCASKSEGEERIRIADEQVYIYSDCDFLSGEPFYILPRFESSLHQLMHFGQVSENIDEDTLLLSLPKGKVFPLSWQNKIAVTLQINPEGTFKLKANEINYELLRLLSLKQYLTRFKQEDQLPSRKEIEQILEEDESLTKSAKRDYLVLLEEVVGNESKLSEDWQRSTSFRYRRQDSKEIFEKSILMMRFYQRRILESQIMQLQKYLLYVSMISDMKQFL